MSRSLPAVDVAVAEVVQAGRGRAQLVVGLRSVAPGRTLSGTAATCACSVDDNLALHRALRAARPGDVLVCAADPTSRNGHFGELMALDALGAGVVGLLIDGPVRDRAALADSGLPVFHRGVGPAPCAKERVVSVGEAVSLGGAVVAPGDRVVADDDGAVVVAAADWEAVLADVRALQAREAAILRELAAGRRLADVLEVDAGEPA